jgi:hypothetical protein
MMDGRFRISPTVDGPDLRAESLQARSIANNFCALWAKKGQLEPGRDLLLLTLERLTRGPPVLQTGTCPAQQAVFMWAPKGWAVRFHPALPQSIRAAYVTRGAGGPLSLPITAGSDPGRPTMIDEVHLRDKLRKIEAHFAQRPARPPNGSGCNWRRPQARSPRLRCASAFRTHGRAGCSSRSAAGTA